MENFNKIDRRIWNTEESRAFLSAYIARKEEFNKARRKKYAMQNVLLDLESQGVLSQQTTAEMLTAKFKNLTRAYKQSTDNNKRTGATPFNVPFADLMDDIFGDSPTISNNHSINLYGQPLEKQQQDTNNESTAANLPSTTKKPRSYRPPLKEKMNLMKIQCKKELSANKIKIFQEYAAKKIEKMEQAQLLK